MQVRDVMTNGAECVRPSDSLQEAARKMRDLDVGPLPLPDPGRGPYPRPAYMEEEGRDQAGDRRDRTIPTHQEDGANACKRPRSHSGIPPRAPWRFLPPMRAFPCGEKRGVFGLRSPQD